jgi:hypothetical protein
VIFYRLRRHPFPVEAFFRHSLVLTFAYPATLLQRLLPPGLTVDRYDDYGFLAIAMVQTKRLHPSFLPEAFGVDFFLTGYRVFARLRARPSLRGLRILRSDTDRRLMALGGNLLTHYGYARCRASVDIVDDRLAIQVESRGRAADLDVVADLKSRPAPLPAGTPFRNLEDARRFAGPLPYTFDYEPETHSIVMIRATRSHWEPQPIAVELRKATFLERPPFSSVKPVLANAFLVENIPYRWERGQVEPLPKAA